MGLVGSYQGTIEKLYALYLEKGFLRTDEALALMTSDSVSLVGVNRITNKLLELGVIFSDGNANDDDDNDRAVVDYEAVFREILSISPSQSALIEYIRNTKPPQNREWHNLIPQMNSGNEYAFNRLFDMYLRVAVRIALRISKDENIELDDAIQEGSMGLMRAIRQYDPNSHGNIGSYLPLWIQQYIDRAIAYTGRAIRIPVHMLETVQKVEVAVAKLSETNGHLPSAEELSRVTGLSTDTVKQSIEILQPILSLEQLQEDDLSFDIVDLGAYMPEEISSENLLKQQISELLKELKPKEETVIRLRCGLDDDHERTLEEVGKIFGVTRERIRQIEAKALRKLCHPSRSKKIKDFL